MSDNSSSQSPQESNTFKSTTERNYTTIYRSFSFISGAVGNKFILPA